jgi:NADPH2:quinone reductase|eukprot:30974-Pelagococcus_subviridis.AAC.3
MMKVVCVESYGGPILWKDVERPRLPHEDDALVATLKDYLQQGRVVAGMLILEVKAVGISFADNLGLHGKYQVKAPLPVIPGAEAAGIVKTKASHVSMYELGDNAGVILPWTTGTCAEEILLHERQCVKLPESDSQQMLIDFVALGNNYQTAYFALVHRAPTSQWHGEILLVLGASGGAGVAALDVGKTLGANVIACASTRAKRILCSKHGADSLVDYSRRGWH